MTRRPHPRAHLAWQIQALLQPSVMHLPIPNQEIEIIPSVIFCLHVLLLIKCVEPYIHYKEECGQDLGIPIEAERRRNGTYVLSAGFKLPPMMFTNEEALALTVGLISARRFNLADTDRAVESAFAKLERVMPLELKSRVRALTETITLDPSRASSTPPSEVVLSTMSSAAQLQQRVHIQYPPPQGEILSVISIRMVSHIISKDGTWWDTAICARTCAHFDWTASLISTPSTRILSAQKVLICWHI